jgi:5'-nucleotidase
MHKFILNTAVCAAALLAATQAFALNIVLTNDDGWDAAGIQAMKEALVADGHTVILSGSLTQQSGSSAAINSGTLEVVKQREFADEGALEYSVGVLGTTEGAEPASAAMVGIGIARQLFQGDPDLVVSGINAGQNLGGFTQISGTVGAATVTLSKGLGGGTLPAIAISTDELCDPEDETGCDEINGPIYDAAAGFVADLILQLDAQDGSLMPQGLGLNINYPPLAPVEGARVTRQGQTGKFPGVPGNVSLTFGCYADCITVPPGVGIPAGITGVAPVEESVSNADTTINAEGYITIVPVRSDFTTGFASETLGHDTAFRAKLNRMLREMGYR